MEESGAEGPALCRVEKGAWSRVPTAVAAAHYRSRALPFLALKSHLCGSCWAQGRRTNPWNSSGRIISATVSSRAAGSFPDREARDRGLPPEERLGKRRPAEVSWLCVALRGLSWVGLNLTGRIMQIKSILAKDLELGKKKCPVERI